MNICNSCGKEITKNDDMLYEDVLFVKKEWGYFSNKYSETHKFIICENCYDRIISNFKRKIGITECA